MAHLGNARRPGRRLLVVLLTALLALVAAPHMAQAKTKAKPAKLTVLSVASPPATLKDGDTFTVTGKVRNAGGRSTAAILAFELQTKGLKPKITYTLGGTDLAKVAPGKTVSFSEEVTLSGATLQEVSDTFRVEVCARRFRGDLAVACAKSPGGATIKAPALEPPVIPPVIPPTEPAPPADTTAPSTTDDVPTLWGSTPVTVTLTAADAGGSGDVKTYFTTGTSPAVPTTASPRYAADAKPVLAAGEKISYFSVDGAGNAEAVHTSTAARVDTVAPTATDNVPSAWRSAPIVVTLSAADTGGSGVFRIYYTTGLAPATPTALSSEYDPADRPVLLNGEKVKYFAVDNAGNAGPVKTSYAARVDADGPATVDNVPSGYVNANPAVTLTATGISGAGRIVYTRGVDPPEPSATDSSVYYAGDKPILANGEKIRYFAISNSGVREATKTSAAAKVDTVAPVTTDSVTSAWSGSAVTVTLTPTDAAAGVAKTYYTKGTSPAAPTTLSAQYDPANKPVLLNGEQIRYFTVDLAGNTEAVKTSLAAKVDLTAPVTTDDVPSGTVTSVPQITLTATDTAGSGVATTYYTKGISPSAPTTASTVYSAANKPTLLDGEQIRYFSVDAVGNAEAVKTSAVAKVDTTTYVAGARTLNDTLFPTLGNGGYDAKNYDADLAYTVASKVLRGTSTMTAQATDNLYEFSMDLSPWMVATKVTVNGEQASFTQGDYDSAPKLVVTPATKLKSGATFTVVTSYAGGQTPVIDPDGSSEGWVPSTTTGATVVSEPMGAQGWIPNNNVPFDKATFNSVKMTVPDTWKVVGTGVQVGGPGDPPLVNGKRTWEWSNTNPTATYLESVSIGKFDIVNSTTAPTGPGGNQPIPFTSAVDSGFTTNKATMVSQIGQTPAILDYFAEYYDVPYPFTSTGGVQPRISVGYSLETQSKPTYATSSSATGGAPGLSTVAHENGHMWFGDFVTLTQWKDIWLNEGMTEFSSWLWQANKNGGTTLAARYASNYTNSTSTSYWNIAPANPPTAADIFNNNAMYNRGATTMEAIREIFVNTPALTETAFRTMMKTWLTSHAYGNATTEQFIALVKATDPARADRWTEFFKQWLYTAFTGSPAAGNKPQINVTNFDTYVLPVTP